MKRVDVAYGERRVVCMGMRQRSSSWKWVWKSRLQISCKGFIGQAKGFGLSPMHEPGSTKVRSMKQQFPMVPRGQQVLQS